MNIDSKISGIIKKIGLEADQQGMKAYLVGGIVRDIFLKRKNLDADIVLEGDAVDFAKHLQGYLKVKPIIYKQFRTATFILSKDIHIDLVTARRETYASSGALPVVYPSHIQDDLFRRDFTINAMAISISKNNFGQLVDDENGMSDLENKKIRVLHDKSFHDDPTRILRAVRFEQRFNFKIEQRTLGLLKEAVVKGYPAQVKLPRYFMEFQKILKEPDPRKGLQRLKKLGGLDFLGEGFTLKMSRLKKIYLQKDLCPKEILHSLYLLDLIVDLSVEKQEIFFKSFPVTRKEKKSCLQIRAISGMMKTILGSDVPLSKGYQGAHNLTVETIWYLRMMGE